MIASRVTRFLVLHVVLPQIQVSLSVSWYSHAVLQLVAALQYYAQWPLPAEQQVSQGVVQPGQKVYPPGYRSRGYARSWGSVQ